jgi:hypothetical protein
VKREDIGRLFGLNYSGVSHAVKSVKPKLAKNRKFQTKFGHHLLPLAAAKTSKHTAVLDWRSRSLELIDD